MNSFATRRFWALFEALPSEVQRVAVRNYSLWRRDPHHPSLRFRRLQGSQDRCTVRIGDHYRALGIIAGDAVTRVWIGTHADYDGLVK